MVAGSPRAKTSRAAAGVGGGFGFGAAATAGEDFSRAGASRERERPKAGGFDLRISSAIFFFISATGFTTWRPLSGASLTGGGATVGTSPLRERSFKRLTHPLSSPRDGRFPSKNCPISKPAGISPALFWSSSSRFEEMT